MKVGLTENKDDDSEDTPCDERKKTSFQHLKKGSKRVDTIPVPSVNILTNLKVVVRQFCQKDGNEAGN